MSQSFFPFIGANPPSDSTLYFETISNSIELDIISEANTISIWSDIDTTVKDASGMDVHAGSFYLPCEGEAVYDVSNNSILFRPVVALDTLNLILWGNNILQENANFSHFVISNVDTDDISYGLETKINEIASTIPPDDLNNPIGEWIEKFFNEGSAIGIASSESSNEYLVRAPLNIGIGKIDAIDPNRRLLKISAKDDQGNVLNLVTIFRLLYENDLLEVLNDDSFNKHPFWEIINYIDENIDTTYFNSVNYKSRGGVSIRQIVIHFISGIMLDQPDEGPYDLNNMQDPFDVDRIINDIFKKYNSSSHYLIDRQGKIFQLVSDDLSAQHVGDSNPYTLGIELMGIGTWDEMNGMLLKDKDGNEFPTKFPYEAWQQAESRGYIGFTESQYSSLAILIDYLIVEHTLSKQYLNSPTVGAEQGIAGHSNYPQTNSNQPHLDPGDYFDWLKVGIITA